MSHYKHTPSGRSWEANIPWISRASNKQKMLTVATNIRVPKLLASAQRESGESTLTLSVRGPFPLLLHNCWIFLCRQMLPLLTVIYFCGSGSNSYNFCLASFYVLGWFIFVPPETETEEYVVVGTTNGPGYKACGLCLDLCVCVCHATPYF